MMRDLAMHVLDVARNGYEAGASLVQVTIREEPEADLLTIVIEDDGKGMSADVVDLALDPFFTTRKTRRVGLGLSLLKATCEQAGRELRLVSVPGQGTTVTATMQLSHFDRPPLGDMGAVVQALACSGEQVDLRYRHTAGGGEFTMDTSEVRRELEDVKLGTPSVLQWLGRTVREGLKEIDSRA
jgi:hypothetical protein